MSTAQVNLLNIGLMLGALALAFALPFELFVFSYAILGPLHYLTEISWLRDRGFFAPRKLDWLPFVLISLLTLLATGYVLREPLERLGLFRHLTGWKDDYAFAAFAIAFVFVVARRIGPRLLGFAIVAGALWWLHLPTSTDAWAKEKSTYTKLCAIYLPTLIHVYVFTGAFILFGALKSRSRSGHASFVVFLCCGASCLLVEAAGYYEVSAFAVANYDAVKFIPTQLHLLNDFAGVAIEDTVALIPKGMPAIDSMHAHTRAQAETAYLDYIHGGDNVYTNPAAVMAMRFIAFAYTYHYLNWFSKTSVIRWHEVPRSRFFAVVAVWLGSVSLYLHDYTVGFQWLFLLSLMHVLLEFPLNHQSFLGIGAELRARFVSRGG